MKRFLYFFFAVLLLVLVSCSNEPSGSATENDVPIVTAKYTREYWGEWRSLDQSETWLISSTSIKVNGSEMTSNVVLSKPSDNVIAVNRDKRTYCIYAIRTASSLIKGNVKSIDASRGSEEGYLSVIIQNVKDRNDRIETQTNESGEFTADDLVLGDAYNVTIGSSSINVTPSYDGEDIGTVTLKHGVNFKVLVSNTNRDMYAGAVYYSMNLIIENIGDENCTAASYSLTWDDGLDVRNNYSEGFLLRTVASGETKTIPISVRCEPIDSNYEIRKLNLRITDKDGNIWDDSVSLKFYGDSATINVVSEDERPISGVIIGDGKTFSITNKNNYSVIVPIIDEEYLMVFSGAIANASRNTECAYSVGVDCTATSAEKLLTELNLDTNSYEPNDDEINATKISSGKTIVSYLYENDIDYYSCSLNRASDSQAAIINNSKDVELKGFKISKTTNGDYSANPGETVYFDLCLNNRRDYTLENPELTLSCNTEGVAFGRASSSWSQLQGGKYLNSRYNNLDSEVYCDSTKYNYYISLDPDYDIENPIEINWSITCDNAADMTGSFIIPVSYVDGNVELQGYQITNTNNDDYAANPGETVFFDLCFKNTGNSTLMNLGLNLTSNNEEVIVEKNYGSWNQLQGGLYINSYEYNLGSETYQYLPSYNYCISVDSKYDVSNPIELEWTVTCDGKPDMTGTFTIPVSYVAGDAELQGYNIVMTSNEDATANPGETVWFDLCFKNAGTSKMNNVGMSLRSKTEGVTAKMGSVSTWDGGIPAGKYWRLDNHSGAIVSDAYTLDEAKYASFPTTPGNFEYYCSVAIPDDYDITNPIELEWTVTCDGKPDMSGSFTMPVQ